MSANNIFERNEFIYEHIFFFFAILFIYKAQLFRCIKGLSVLQSMVVLSILSAAGITAGILLHIRHSRNYFCVFCDILAPFGIYTAVMYYPVKTAFIRTVIFCVLAVSFLYGALILLRRIKNRQHAARILLRRLRRAAASAHIFTAAGMTVIMANLIILRLFTTTVMQPAIPEQEPVFASYEQNVAAHMDTLQLLQPETWEKMSVSEKLSALQIIAQLEQCYLGISQPLTIGADDLGQYGYQGGYVESTHQIILDLNHLSYDPPDEVLDTLCHEIYHHYQHLLTDIYLNADEEAQNLRIFQNIRHYAEEFQNYNDGKDDFYDYYFQACESDARDYAGVAVERYYRIID